MSNKRRTVLYTGITSNLANRVYEHQNGIKSTFTSKYKCFELMYYEFHEDIESAIIREKQIKKWKRAWKDKLIQETNPELRDLSNEIEEMQ